jgi:5-methylcytosine-specific restriction endonuclease McrA
MYASAESDNYSSDEILRRDGGKCQLCNRPINRNFAFPHSLSLSIDHIIPLSRGGDDTLRNVQAAHLGCNCSKGNRDAEEQLLLVG